MTYISRAIHILFTCVCVLCCASCGPHMDEQPSITPYERQMPNMPAGTVPTKGSNAALTATHAVLTTSPVPATPAAIRDGHIYYVYYCEMCHGSEGNGEGPVGQSYSPKPADFASAKVKSMTDGQLYSAMLNGIGHAPVMVETVFPDQRWPLVQYVRVLSGKPAPVKFPTVAPANPPMPTTPSIPSRIPSGSPSPGPLPY